MIAYLCVALGSALGGVGRYGFALLAGRLWGESFPWGTIAINVLGSFVIGFFGAMTAPEGPVPAHPNLRIFVMVGICGGFTTFSSFSLQTLSLARDGSLVAAMGNVVLSVTLCLLAVTGGHLAAGWIGLLQSQASAVPHSILAIIDQADTARPVLAAAALAAGRFGSTRIEALHVRHEALQGFMPSEDVMTEERRREIKGDAARLSDELREIFDTWRAAGGVREWREVVGETANVIAGEAANADLIVVGHGAWRHQADAQRAVHVALFVSRLPTLLVPAAIPVSLGRSVAIAWKPSDAANRAIGAALPLLMNAERVSVLIETGGETAPGGLPGVLERLGIKANVVRFQAEGKSVGQALIDRAHAGDADLLVMGAYTNNRLTEFITGGVTREVLAAADLPVLMHH